MKGQSAEAVRADLERQNVPPERLEPLIPQKVHQGSRPNTIVLFERTDPKTVGKLIALYEHKVFTQGVVWGINPFDQWGAKLGKKLAEQIIPAVKDPASAHQVSAGMAKLLRKMAEWRGDSYASSGAAIGGAAHT